MKKNIIIPKFFHELFGSEQNPVELMLVLAFTVFSTIAILFFTNDYWMDLTWYQNLVLWLLYLDISGGVIANLTHGTNAHYSKTAKMRWVFISIHVQPLILASVLKSPISTALIVWGFTMISACIVNVLRGKVYQRTLAGFLMSTAILGFVLLDFNLPSLISIIYLLYIIKVIYSFSVDHQGI